MNTDAAFARPTIREAFVSKRTMPRNFRANDAALFAHEFERTIPAMELRDLTNVRSNADGILFKGVGVLRESFASAGTFKDVRSRKRSQIAFLLRNYLLKRRRRLAGRFLCVTDDWSHGYFHWLADALPRLFAVRDLARENVLLLPSRYENLEYVRATLGLFGIADIEYVRPPEICVSERLLLPTHAAPSGSFNDALMRELRDFILDSYGIDRRRQTHRRIYVSRGRAARRRIVNEEDVIGVLREHDFEVLHFEDHPFEQQVRIAAASSLIVSNHGAGLTNMLFMPEGTRVLELRREGERERNCFFNLASATRLGYYYQSCPQEHPEDPVHTANVIVDVEALRKNLALMLEA